MADGLVIPFRLDEDQPRQVLDRTARELEEIRALAGEIGLSIDFDDGEAARFLSEFEGLKRSIEGPIDVDLDVDPGSAQQSVARVRDEYGRFVKEAEEPVDVGLDTKKAESDLSTIRKLARTAASSFSLDQAGSFLTDFGQEGLEAQQTLRELQARTGATADEMVRLEEAGRDAFRLGVGDSVAEATSAIAVAKQQLGEFVDDSELAGITQQAAGLAKTFDVDVNDVIARARPFISQFKLEGEEAFNLISLGMQKAGSASDDFLDTIDEYSDKMVGAGVGAEEFTGILINGIQAGFRNTDQLADSVKEMALRMREGAITEDLEKIPGATSQAIQAIVKLGEEGELTASEVLKFGATEIKKAVDAGTITDATREQLQVALSGTLGEEIGGELYGKIFAAEIDTSAITEQAKIAGDQIVGAVEPKGLAESIGREFDAVRAKVAEVVGPIAAEAGQAATAFGQMAPGIEVVRGRINELGGTSEVFGRMTTSVGGFQGGIGKLGKSLKSLALGPVGAIAALAAILVLAYNESEALQAAVGNLVEVLGVALAPIADQLGTLFGQLLEAVSPLLVSVGELAGTLLTALSPILEIVIGVLAEILSVVGSLVAEILDVLTPAIEFLAGLLSGLVGVIGDLVGWLVDGLLSVLVDIGNFLRDVFIAAWNGVVAAAEAVWDAITSVVNVYIDVYKAIFDGVKAVGSFVVELLGIGDAVDLVIGPIEDLIGGVGEFVDGLFGGGDAMDEFVAKAQELEQQNYKLGTSFLNMARDAVNAAAEMRAARNVANFITDMFSSSGDEAESVGEEIGSSVGRGVSRSSAPKKAAADFTDKLETALRAESDLRRQFSIAAIENERDRIDAQQEWKLDQIRRSITDEITAIEEKVSELEAKREKGYEVEITNAVEAKDALRKQLVALEEQQAEQRLEALRKFHEAELAEIERQADAVVDAEIRRLRLINDLADRSTLSGLVDSVVSQTRQIDLELDRQLEAFADADERLIALRSETARKLADESLTTEEAERLIADKRHEIIAEALEDDFSLVSLLTRKAEEEKKAIAIEYTRERARIEEDALREENALYRAALIVRDNLFAQFLEGVDTERQADLQRELDDIETRRDAWLDLFNDAKIGRSELFDEMSRLGEREQEILDEMSGAGRDLIDSLKEGAQASLEIFGADFGDRAADSLKSASAILTASEKELRELGLTADDLNDKLVDTALETSAQLAAVTAAQALEGENVLDSFARNLLDITLKLLVAESKAVVALIFGKSVAANPLTGALAAAGLIGAFTILANLAKSALSNAFFHGTTGGRTVPGGPLDVGGVVHGGEYVTPWYIAKDPRTRAVLEGISTGVDPLEAAIAASRGYWQTLGGIDPNRPEIRAFITDVIERFGGTAGKIDELTAALVESQNETAALRAQLEKNTERLERVAARFERKTSVEHEFDDAKLDGSDIKISVSRTKAREVTL